MKKNYKIGVNSLSLGPWAVRNPFAAAQAAAESGYSFLQQLPVRGLKKDSVLSLPIYYVEDAWNSWGDFAHVCKSLIPWLKGSGEVPSPIDWLVFKPKEEGEEINRIFLENQNCRKIVHKLEKGRSLVEVSPKLGLSLEELFHHSQDNFLKPWLVLDTSHCREIENNNWPVHLPQLVPYIVAVHVAPLNTEELNRFLAGEETELENMIQLIKMRCEGHLDWIVECRLSPKDWLPGRAQAKLALFYKRLEAILQ